MRSLAAMELLDATSLGAAGPLLLVLGVAVAIFIGAVWFGLRVIAPRLGRAIDRAEEDDNERD